MPEAKHRKIQKQVPAGNANPLPVVAPAAKTALPEGAKIHLVAEKADAKPAKAKQEKAESSGKQPLTITSFWPVGVGLFLSGFAPEWHAIATQWGPWVMRFTFPYALLATHREIGIDEQMAGLLPQFAMFAQLPLDGLMMTFSMATGKGLKAAIIQVTMIHAICAFVLWLLTFLA